MSADVHAEQELSHNTSPRIGPQDQHSNERRPPLPKWMHRWRLLVAAKMWCPPSKGERMLRESKVPQVIGKLPANLLMEDTLCFDPVAYNLRHEACLLLDQAGPSAGFGYFDESNRELESFHAKEAVFSSFKYEKRWRLCILERRDFLTAYERLVEEVVCPFLRAKINSEEPVTFYYQHPPTLRLQPGPSDARRRLHRDAEFGHQDGEINFWMPLTDYSKTGTTLWVESRPNASDFHPFDINYGTIGMFHGTNVRHFVPSNASNCLRVSMDFRIGIGKFFDPDWNLEGIEHVHRRRECVL